MKFFSHFAGKKSRIKISNLSASERDRTKWDHGLPAVLKHRHALRA